MRRRKGSRAKDARTILEATAKAAAEGAEETQGDFYGRDKHVAQGRLLAAGEAAQRKSRKRRATYLNNKILQRTNRRTGDAMSRV
jgi:hypothetical protein